MDSTGPASIDKAIRQEKALAMRVTGATYREIGTRLEVSRAQAHRDVAEALAEITREPAQHVLDMELGRCDAMLAGLYPDAVGGDVKAVLAVLKIMDRRARYLGLDAAAPPDTSGDARTALANLHNAIVAAADRIDPIDPDEHVDGDDPAAEQL